MFACDGMDKEDRECGPEEGWAHAGEGCGKGDARKPVQEDARGVEGVRVLAEELQV